MGLTQRLPYLFMKVLGHARGYAIIPSLFKRICPQIFKLLIFYPSFSWSCLAFFPSGSNILLQKIRDNVSVIIIQSVWLLKIIHLGLNE